MPVIYLIICAAFALVMISAIMTLLSRQEKERFTNALTYLSTVIYAGNQELIPKNGAKWIFSWSPKHDDYLRKTKLSKQRKLQVAEQWKEHMKLLDSLPINAIQTGTPTSSLTGLPYSSFDNVKTESPNLTSKDFQTSLPSIGYSGLSGIPQQQQEEKPQKPKKSAPKKEKPKTKLHPVTPKQLDLD